MTKKSKFYLAVIAGSLLFAAGSLAWQYMRSPYSPPAPEELRQEETQAPQPEPAPAAAAEFEGRMQAYFADPLMKAFNDDIAAAAGDISQADFISGAAHEKYFNNPQIQKILLKYSEDPAFLELMRKMIADETFIKGIEQAAQIPPDIKKTR